MPTPLRVLDLLSNKVERVPARVREQSWIKSQGNAARLRGGTLEWIVEVLCFSCVHTRKYEKHPEISS